MSSPMEGHLEGTPMGNPASKELGQRKPMGMSEARGRRDG